MENYKILHEKFIRIAAGIMPGRFIEAISRIENRLSAADEIGNIALVPLEANFQLPNVFLNTRRSNKVEKLFTEHASDASQGGAIEQIVGWLDDILFESGDEQGENADENKRILNEMIKYRFGR